MSVRATITSINGASSVKASISYVKPEADAHINNISKNQWFYENTLLSELSILVITKPLTDSVSILEDFNTHPSLAKADAVLSVLDNLVRVVVYNRTFNDVFTLDDASLVDKDYYGNKGNVAFMLDIIGLDHEKLLNDSYSVGDVVGIIYSKFADDTANLGDVLAFDADKSLVDAFAVTDLPSLAIQPTKIDSVSTSDSSYLYTQPNKADSVSMGDVYSRVLAKYLSDTVALDDGALIDKDYTGTKGNVATMLDVMGLSYEPAVADSYNVTDVVDQVWEYVRQFNDHIVLTDNESNPLGTNLLNTSKLNASDSQFELYRGNDQVDTFGVSDVAAVTPGKNFVDALAEVGSAFSDYDIFNLIKKANDTLNLTEVFNLVSTYPKIDAISLGDIAGVELSKVFADGFAVDDAAVVDKNYYGNKGNIYTLTDILTLTNVFNRQFGDSLGVTEVLNNHLSKLLEENNSQLVFSDTINVRHVTGGILNRTPLNRIKFN